MREGAEADSLCDSPFPELRFACACDRYEHHTQHCPACRGALKQVVALQTAAMASAGALGCLLLLVAKNNWQELLARQPLALALGMAACLFLYFKLKELQSKFNYTDYIHWNK